MGDWWSADSNADSSRDLGSQDQLLEDSESLIRHKNCKQYALETSRYRATYPSWFGPTTEATRKRESERVMVSTCVGLTEEGREA
ncbi:hypothetical protein PSENEW3_00004888 [Picochlorum sp. SENEW3]|nr:hypothetical protein PSENEW3_00004888 [Picochlorum sp. SENEW3]